MKKIFLLAFLALSMVRALAQPSTAATAPIADPATVLSLFGNTYTQVSQATGTGTWYPNWGQSTQVTYTNIGGDTTIEYSNLNYQGVQFPSSVNAGSMDSVHFDVWTNNCSSLQFNLINTSPSTVQVGYTVHPTQGGWTSVSIPLSAFSPVALDNIGQLMFVGSGTIYLQNIYFFQAIGKPTITGFSIPAQTLGASPYTITDPTSNSLGAFSYTSSNPLVATISGNVITIIGVGTSIITANQAADSVDGYSAASVVASLVVSYAGPTTAAPVPTTASPYVISLWGDAYTNVSGINWYPGWGQSTSYSTPTVGGKSTIEYQNLNYEGVQFSSDLDASNMDSLVFNVWTPNVTTLQVNLIKTTGGTVQQGYNVTLTQNGWNRVSIPLASAFNLIDLAKIGQMMFVGENPGSGGVIYLQNIYFVNAVGKPTLTGFTIPAQTLGVNSTYTLNPTSNSTGAITYTSSNTAVATVSGNVLTIVGAGTSTITATEAADSNYTAATFTTVLTVNYADPTTGAPTPTAAAGDVISLFGNHYTQNSNAAGNANGSNVWYQNWGQATAVTYTKIGGDTTLKYSNLNYQGVQFQNTIDAAGMDSLHLDIWTPNLTQLNIDIIGGTGEVDLTRSLTEGTWNSVNIPLSAYTAAGLGAVLQFKFDITPLSPSSGGLIYLQNVYFFKTPGKPTISGFTLPSNITTASSPFTITAPTSNSAGSFSYTSSNTSVATISGSTVTVHSVGSTVITATQAADPTDGYISGSIVATLNVGYPGPTTAAAVPTASSANVLSLYGNTYTNVSGTNWEPGWGGPVQYTALTVGGKSTLEYSALGYEGVQLATGINVSSKNILHFDVWTPNCTAFELYLISTDNGGVNQLVDVTPTTNGWNSINIPLASNFSSTVLSDINQIKINAVTPASGAVLYLQNIYFVNATPTWTGTTSTDFSLASNWQYGLTPVSTNSVSIPASLTHEPVLSTNTTLAGIALNGTLGLGGNTLTLTGAVTGSGSLSGSATSSLVVAGTVGTLNFSSNANSLENLTITSGSATLGNALNIYGTFTPTAGTFNTGGNLTLKSTSITNTAVVGVVGGTINGTVTVERYIPSGKRTYRDLGAEVANAGSVFNNWQEGGVNNNGYGIQITGKQGTSAGTDATTGFDYSLTGNYSMFTYPNNTWTPVSTTKGTNLNPYQGYRVLVRGDRTGSLQTQLNGYMWSPATIRSKGNLITGTVTFSNLTSGVGSCSFVANPYVSPVDWDAVVSASTGINGTFWYCDPTFLTDSGYTTFVAYNNSTGVSNPLGLSNVNRYLQPGQAFFVENATTTPSLVFTEACKATAQSKTAIFGTTTTLNRIAVGLYKNNTNIDGAATVFNSDFSNTIGKEDAIKFANGGENLALTVAGKDLCINGYSLPTSSDVLPIHLYNLQANTAYTIRLDASQYTSNGVSAFIKDNVSNTQTLLAGDNTALTFTTKASDANSYSNRYSIVFGANPLPVKEMNVTAAVQSNAVLVKWSTTGENNVANYYVEHSTNGVDFTELTSLKADNTATANYSYVDASAKEGNNYYRIKAVDNTGSISYSTVVIASIGKSKGTISTYPNPVVGNTFNLQLSNVEGGNYTIRIISKLGQEVYVKSINHISGSSSEQVSMHSVAAGTYMVSVANGNGVSYQTQIEVK